MRFLYYFFYLSHQCDVILVHIGLQLNYAVISLTWWCVISLFQYQFLHTELNT